jgi:hypothetical protein
MLPALEYLRREYSRNYESDWDRAFGAFNIAILGVFALVIWLYAAQTRFLKDGSGPIRLTAERRIIAAQALYAIGATLCAINTHMSIVF